MNFQKIREKGVLFGGPSVGAHLISTFSSSFSCLLYYSVLYVRERERERDFNSGFKCKIQYSLIMQFSFWLLGQLSEISKEVIRLFHRVVGPPLTRKCCLHFPVCLCPPLWCFGVEWGDGGGRADMPPVEGSL